MKKDSHLRFSKYCPATELLNIPMLSALYEKKDTVFFFNFTVFTASQSKELNCCEYT